MEEYNCIWRHRQLLVVCALVHAVAGSSGEITLHAHKGTVHSKQGGLSTD